MSIRTVVKWLARWRVGDRTLLDRSSRPQRQPRRLVAAVAAQIVALRHTRAIDWEISATLQIPRSTVTRVLRTAGLNRLRNLEPGPPDAPL